MRAILLVALVGCGSGKSPGGPGTDAPASCPETIAARCSGSSLNCPMTWTAAHAASSWSCQGATRVILADCGAEKVATTAGVDSGLKLYYDASGALYRIDSYSAGNGDVCLAGGGTFDTCNDPNAQTIPLCPP